MNHNTWFASLNDTLHLHHSLKPYRHATTDNRQPTTDNRQPLRLALRLAALALMSAVLITACRKEEPSPTLPGATSDAAQVNPTPRIKAFIERALAADAKSGGTLSVDSAVWYVEAALNYSMAGAHLAQVDIFVDSIQHAMPLTGGLVSDIDAGLVFLELASEAEVLVEPGGHIVLIDVVEKFVNGDCHLMALVFVSLSQDAPKNINATYTGDDYWEWGGGSSECQCLWNPATTGICADKRIQARMAHAIGSISVECYYTNVETWTIERETDTLNNVLSYMEFLNPDDDNANDWWHDYQTYACIETYNCIKCLFPSSMSHYTQGTWDAAHEIRTTYCGAGKVLATAVIDGLSVSCTPTPCTHWYHRAILTYGHLSCGEES